MEVVRETRHMFIIKYKDAVFRVPKDPKAIPNNSIMVRGEDITEEVRKFVEEIGGAEE